MVGQYYRQGLNVGLAIQPSWVYRGVHPSLWRPLRAVGWGLGGGVNPILRGGDLATMRGGLALFGHSRAKCPALPHWKQAIAGPTRACAGRSGERGSRGPKCSRKIPSSRRASCCRSLLVARSPTASWGGVLGGAPCQSPLPA